MHYTYQNNNLYIYDYLIRISKNGIPKNISGANFE